WVESGTAALKSVTLGAASDVPVPADYDGDGKADAAIWQAATGSWQIQRSSDGKLMTRTHGQSGDAPIQARRN
ncbi:MAG TPA: VCBS repeat-containing protein, partial [Blastocatellia bacterium]|nr:VCBS repeat-containing protein [Blastocatellia bacterium]HMV84012.1 VCBS repeat-containing protein [Blastocatellia bacterium]HNG33937.1 VCBS repeat-containing protein [Blastocatellia bacterium]